MFNLFQLLYILFSLLFNVLTPGDVSTIIAENIILKQQLLILSRHKKRAPNLSNSDRLIFGFFSRYLNLRRLTRLTILIKPATLIKLHKIFVSKKYRSLFTKKACKKPGRKGPTQEIIDLVLKYKANNPKFGYLRIAMQISNQFGIKISSDIVRRIGFSVHKGDMDGVSLCRMFNNIISKQKLPQLISTDNDPLFKFARWKANLRILEIEHIKSIPGGMDNTQQNNQGF